MMYTATALRSQHDASGGGVLPLGWNWMDPESPPLLLFASRPKNEKFFSPSTQNSHTP